MEDAYVIGIRLALENGVSAGIAAISSELASLDAAIAATTSHLERLQTLARSTEIPRQRQSPDASAAPAQPDPMTPAQTNPGATFATPAHPMSVEQPRAASPGTATAPPVVRIITQTTDATPAAPSATVFGALGQATVQPSVGGMIAQAASPTTNRPAIPMTPIPPAPRPPRAPDGPMSPTRPAGHGATSVDRQAAPAEILSSPSGSRGDHAAPLAPSAPTAQNGTAPQRVAAAPIYPGTSAAPPPRDSSGGAMRGDVYLDGSRLGHWIGESLARQAGGPSNGTSGFDPRLGPAWPGASQGF